MKHSLFITFLLIAFFLLAQFIGLGIIYKYIDQVRSAEEGETVFKDLPVGERPPLKEETSFLPIFLTLVIGTVLLLFIIKRNLVWIWKIWFLMAVVISLTIALGIFVNPIFAFIAALIFGLWKIFKPNFIIHNITELFIYGGLAAIFVPLFNLLSVSLLMIGIALYDAYAVWKSKHMITLAKSQAQSKVFAGFLLPYKIFKAKPKPSMRTKPVKVRTAVLGGGDIGFPLIFAGVIMKEMGLWQSLIIPLFASLGLIYLLWKGDEGKFYPAMPFIGAGCFLGLGLVWLLTLF